MAQTAERPARSLRIGIDYTSAVRQRAGIGRYTRNLIWALAELDSDNLYTLFVAGGTRRDRVDKDLTAWPANYRIRSVPISDRWLNILWQRFRLPLPVQWVTGRLDLFHSPDFVLPPVGRIPTILTVHDLSFLRVPHCFLPEFRQYLETAVARAVRRTQWILADSENTRQDLIELLAVEPERVSVLYPGVEPHFRPMEGALELERVRIRYGLPHRFILGVGTLQPRKNFDGLIRAFAQLLAARGHDPGFDDVYLVIVGEKGWMYEEVLALPQRLGVGERVRFTGFVEDADLPALYTLAEVLAFPSWYEGFGLPVLEAMACGTAVVAADNSSLPEVVGEGGLLVHAGDLQAWAEALARLLTDGDLRARLITAGREQAQHFTWEESARRLLTIYQAVGTAQIRAGTYFA